MSEFVHTNIEEGVAHIRFNRPEALNVLDLDLARAFCERVTLAVDDPSVRVIVLSGEGRAFCAGGDLAYFRAAQDRSQAAHRLIEPIHRAVMILASARQPVIASVQGVAAGAGASLVFAADLAIAAEDAGLNLAYVNVAATPDCSASWSLPRLVGLRKSMEIALLGERIDASEALGLGLFNRVVPSEALEDETRKLAQRLSRAAPLALQGIKRLLRESLNRTLQEQLAAEQLSFASGAATEDFHEALEAFFARRPPHFAGR